MRMERRRDRQTDITKLTVALLNFAKASKNSYSYNCKCEQHKIDFLSSVSKLCSFPLIRRPAVGPPWHSNQRTPTNFAHVYIGRNVTICTPPSSAASKNVLLCLRSPYVLMSSGLSKKIRIRLLRVKTCRISYRVVSEEHNSSNCRVVKEEQITVNMAALRRFEMLIRATDMTSYCRKFPTNVYLCEDHRTRYIQNIALCNEDATIMILIRFEIQYQQKRCYIAHYSKPKQYIYENIKTCRIRKYII